jgi:hypothetical protein
MMGSSGGGAVVVVLRNGVVTAGAVNEAGPVGIFVGMGFGKATGRGLSVWLAGEPTGLRRLQRSPVDPWCVLGLVRPARWASSCWRAHNIHDPAG